MRIALIIFTIALMGGSLNARPTVEKEDDFSVDMWSNGNHLRYVRSTDAATSGTVVTVEKPATTAAVADDKPHEAAEAKTTAAETAAVEKIEQKEPLKLEEAMKLVSATVEKLHAENSIAPEAEAANAAAAHVEVAKEWKSEKKEEPVSSLSSSSSSKISAPSPTFTHLESNDEIVQSSYARRFVNPYGDVLDRITEKTHPLAAQQGGEQYRYEEYEQQPRELFKSQQQLLLGSSGGKQDRIRTLSSQKSGEKQPSSVSVSRIVVGGKEIKADNNNSIKRINPSSYASSQAAPEMASLLRQRGNFASGLGFGAPRQGLNLMRPGNWQANFAPGQWAAAANNNNKWTGVQKLNAFSPQQPIFFRF